MSDIIEQRLNADLAAFNADPKAFMNRQPPKTDAAGNPIEGFTVFSQQDIDSKAYIDARDAQRLKILQPDSGEPGGVSARAAIQSNDKPVNLVDSLKYSKLADMEAAGLKKATLAESPWSDDYWAIYKGILGARYADPSFPKSSDWKANYDYVRARPSASILASGDASKINRLSPAEKYDALVGDTSESLTKKMWAEGKYYYDQHGSVETWMGICHGWAPAAYMLARPTKSVTLKTPTGVAIKFYPSDIKALASLLWANAAGRTKFIGGRCNDSDPATDPTTGRATSADCFDTNPGTWHLSMVNQLGASKRSTVMDVTFDYEVWNQPVYAYEYRYFNPQSMYYASTLSGATVSKAAFTSDRFRTFRGSQYVSVVGVQMEVSYVVETNPSQRETDSPTQDGIQKVTYLYDLELDSANNIIGGEWYTNKHPDFLWTPGKGIRAATSYEGEATGSWQQGSALPSSWRAAAKRAAAYQSAPLAAIVEQIIKFSTGAQVVTRAETEATTPDTPAAPTAPAPQPSPATPPVTPAPAPTPTPSSTAGSAPATPSTTSTSSSTTAAPAGSWWSRMLRRWFG